MHTSAFTNIHFGLHKMHTSAFTNIHFSLHKIHTSAFTKYTLQSSRNIHFSLHKIHTSAFTNIHFSLHKLHTSAFTNIRFSLHKIHTSAFKKYTLQPSRNIHFVCETSQLQLTHYSYHFYLYDHSSYCVIPILNRAGRRGKAPRILTLGLGGIEWSFVSDASPGLQIKMTGCVGGPEATS